MKDSVKEIIFGQTPSGMPPQQRRRNRQHQIWVGVMLTLLALGVGFLSLILSAAAYSPLPGLQLLLSYFKHPMLLMLNLLPAVVLVWLFYFAFGHAWVGFLAGGVPIVVFGLANYYKIQLRGDPLLGADIALISEAKGIVGRYSLELKPLVILSLVCVVLGLLFAVFLLPRGVKNAKVRIAGAVGALAVLMLGYFGVYRSDRIYAKTENLELVNRWSDVEVYVSKGGLYPFVHSLKDMFPKPPQGYQKEAAAQILSAYTDADIPEEGQISIVGVMLEAFCDLSLYEALADDAAVQEVYRPWHALEAESVSGQLVTNIFAGGTVDSEWCFLTGYSDYDSFRTATDSYVWYFDRQGYATQGGHPGFGWFYNRQNVNEYLGFSEYWFTENYYGELVDPNDAVRKSDGLVMQEILAKLRSTLDAGQPAFSFSVTYQNHGPYWSDASTPEFITEASGLSQESREILNGYLRGIDLTVQAMAQAAEELEGMQQPVILVLFGDHKPWLGNGNSVYTELGELFDLGAKDGFYSYYSTPYLIWANSAAKEIIGHDMTGEGADISPCFLMTELFDLCGWEGPAFMQYSRALRDVTTVVHRSGRYLQEGVLTQNMSAEEMELLQQFERVQYYRQHEITPQR